MVIFVLCITPSQADNENISSNNQAGTLGKNKEQLKNIKEGTTKKNKGALKMSKPATRK